MEEIVKIARIITSGHLKKSQNILDDSAKGSKLRQLYDRITAKNYKHEDEISRDLYKTKSTAPTYRMLKWRLQGALEDVFFQYEATDISGSPYQTQFQYCQRKLSVISLLLMFGLRSYCMSMTEKLLKRARDYDLSEIELHSLKILRSMYWHTSDLQGYNTVTVELQRCLEKIQAELRAEELYDRFSMPYMNRKAPPEYPQRQVQKTIDEINSLRRKYKTYAIHIAYYRLMGIINDINHDYKGVIRICEETERFFEAKPQLSSYMRLGESYNQKAEAHMYLRDYKKAQLSIEQALDLFPAGATNWFNAQSLNFLLAMRTRNVAKAAAIYSEVIRNERFPMMPERIREEWLIYGAYVNVAARLWNIPQPKISVNKRETRVSTLLNDAALYEKDKHGAYVALRIYQVVRYILDDDRTKLNKMDKAILNYTYRYSDVPSESIRSVTMLRLLRYAFMTGVSPTRLRNNKIIKRYTSVLDPRKSSLNIAPMEIIPYEMLWETLVDFVEQRALKAAEKTS